MAKYCCAILLFYFIPLFRSGAQTWVPRKEVSFDFSTLRRLESGPPGHVYALDEKMNLALIRFDTLVRQGTPEISASIVKTLPLRYWKGYEKELRQFDFSSVSEDGRYLALALTSRIITGIETDGSPMTGEKAKEEIFLLDFASRKLEFRAETGKRTASVFFGQTLRYSDYSEGNCRLMAKDPEEVRPRVFVAEGKNMSSGMGRHLSLSSEGMSEKEEFLVQDGLQQLQFRLRKGSFQMEKEGYPVHLFPMPDTAVMEIFRLRDCILLHSSSSDTLFLVNPKNAGLSMLIPDRSEEKTDFRSCLLNGHLLTGFSRGCFTFLDVRNGSRARSKPLLMSGKASIPQAGSDGKSGFLKWENSRKLYRFFPGGREFALYSGTASDSFNLQLPMLNSKNFRLRTTRFVDDSSRQKEESSFAPGIFLNGQRLGSYYGNSVSKFISMDISEKAGLAFLSYYQPRLIAIERSGKHPWTSDFPSAVQAIKADEDGQSLFCYSENGVIDFLNTRTGKKYLSLIFDESGKEWMLWTPAGYYDASPGGGQLLHWLPSFGNEGFPGLFSMEFFSSAFRKPEVVDAVMLCRDEATALKRLKAATAERCQKKRLDLRPPHIYMEFPGDRFLFSGTGLLIPYFETEGRLPIKKIQISIDGQARPDYLPDGRHVIRLSSLTGDCTLELTPYSAAGPGEKLFCRLKKVN